MKIHLDENELKTIIQEHLVQQMPDLSNRTFDIQLIAGRGENGHRAEVEIVLTPPASAAKKVADGQSDSEEEPAIPFNFGGEDESHG